MATHEKENKRQEFYNSLPQDKKNLYWLMTNNLSILFNYKEQLEEIEKEGNGRLVHSITGLIGNIEKIILGNHDLELIDDDLCILINQEVENYKLTLEQLKKLEKRKVKNENNFRKYL